MRGADQGLAYVPVVAGSDRATILHYTHNDRCLDENNLILVDAGAKAFGYCSDISRTWPHKSKFSHEQKQLYEAVLRVQQTCIERVQRHQKNPVSFLDLNILASELIFKEIVNLGFPATRETVETVFPHSIGHHLGLDLHDCATIEINRPLTKDMCITIEPGIYVPCSPSFPECFHGMGIRIEDDLLLTHDGVSVLTSSVPKSIDDLEAL